MKVLIAENDIDMVEHLRLRREGFTNTADEKAALAMNEDWEKNHTDLNGGWNA